MSKGARPVPGQAFHGGHRLTLLAAVSRSAQAAVHTRRLHSACAAIPQDGQRQRDARLSRARWLCPACATAAYALRIAFAFSLKRIKKQKVHHFSIYGA